MEIIIEKENGAPMSGQESAALFRFLHDKLIPQTETKEECPVCKLCKNPHNVEIFFKEDDSYVYAAVFCPGISKDRIEVLIDGTELVIGSKPADPAPEKDGDICSHSPWKCIEDITYEGKRELPSEIIAEQATAELSNGVLYIQLPKPETVKPRTVAVN